MQVSLFRAPEPANVHSWHNLPDPKSIAGLPVFHKTFCDFPTSNAIDDCETGKSGSQRMDDLTDTSLITRAQNGDVDAFNMLVWRWQAPILNFLYRFLGNREDAEDVCQRTFLKVYSRLGDLEHADRFRVWLYQIATNQARDFLRKKRRLPFFSFFVRKDGNGEDNELDFPDPESDAAEREVENHQLRSILERAMQELPEEQRAVIIMRIYQELKFVEIAEILGESINTVKSRMYYGLRALRNILQRQGLGEEVNDYEV